MRYATTSEPPEPVTTTCSLLKKVVRLSKGWGPLQFEHPLRSALDQLLCVGRVPDRVRNSAPDSMFLRFIQSVMSTTRIGGIGTVRRLLLVFGPAISSSSEFQRSPATPDQALVTRIDPQPSSGSRRSSASSTAASGPKPGETTDSRQRPIEMAGWLMTQHAIENHYELLDVGDLVLTRVIPVLEITLGIGSALSLWPWNRLN
jgi:hypothetical protein